jgi:hypothetical protein
MANIEDAPNLRVAVVRKLGGKCRNCGWAEDEAVLQIIDMEGNSTKEYKGRDREKYFLQILNQTADTGRYVVLCANCKQIHMKKRRAQVAAEEAAQAEAAKPNPKTLPVFVYASGEGVECLRDEYSWIDKHVKAGREAFVWLYDVEGGPVYRYGHPKEPVARSWAEFTAKEGLPPDEPKDAANLIERIKPQR